MPQQVKVELVDGKIVITGVGVTFEFASDSPPPPPPPPDPDPEPTPQNYIWVDVTKLPSKQRSGRGWDAMYSAATAAAPGPASVSNQDSKHNTWLQACSYVYAATGETAFLNKVLAGLRSICSPSLPIGRALALAREIPGYIGAAEGVQLWKVDLDLHAQFSAKLRYFLTCATSGGGPGTLIESQEERPNNWGTHASCARIMIARYLDDGAELERAVRVFRGFLGEWELYHGFVYGADDWQYEKSRPLGVNRKGAVIEGHSVDGALPEELRRAGGFVWPPGRTDYCWEAEQGITASILLLENAGLPAKTWSDWAHLRSIKWLYDVAGWPPSGDDAWQVPVINLLYGTNFEVPDGGPGKNLGWTEFCFM